MSCMVLVVGKVWMAYSYCVYVYSSVLQAKLLMQCKQQNDEDEFAMTEFEVAKDKAFSNRMPQK